MASMKHAESAEKFRAALAKLGLTQVAFAAEVEMGDRHIRKFCSGECEVPKLVWMAIDLIKLRQRAERERARKHK
jgi:hypothetical protein